MLPRDLALLMEECAALAAVGRTQAAQRKLEAALRRQPEAAPLHAMLARLLAAHGLALRAQHHLRRAIALDPQSPSAHLALIRLHGEARQLPEARAAAHAATRSIPGNPAFLFQLSVAELHAGDPAASIASLEAALAIDPTHAPVLYNLATILDAERKWDEAAILYRRARAADTARELDPFNPGSIELRIGEVEHAIASEEAWLAKHPHDAKVLSNLLMAAQYRPGVTSESLLPLHRRWQTQVADRLPKAPPPPRPTDPHRPLRVGLLCADFRNHPTPYLSIAAIEHLDPGAIILHAYDTAPATDAMATRLRAAIPAWRDLPDQPDDAILRAIRDDAIDILIDLSGHIAGSRLGVFARRAAPVQASWLGYVGTTGLDEMDWLIADRHLVPPDDDPWMAERVLRLPDAYCCFLPPDEAPEVGPLPAGDDRPLAFAAFHTPAKINAEVIALWSRVLQSQPGSTIRFTYDGYHLRGVQARIAETFAAHGIEVTRLAFTGPVTRAEMLAAYTATDIALDPFPYGGGLTTCEALWMGVPVVTLPGRTFAGRHAASHLAAAGIDGLVARDPDHYVAIIAALSADRPALRRQRADLRPRMAASPLCDAPRFAANLGAGLRHMWRAACAATSRAGGAADHRPSIAQSKAGHAS